LRLKKAAFFAAFSFTSEFFLKTYQSLIFDAKLTVSFVFYAIANTNRFFLLITLTPFIAVKVAAIGQNPA